MIAAHQCWGAALGEPCCKQLFVTVPQTRWSVYDQCALGLCSLQDIGGIDVLHIKRGVFTHQDKIEFIQRGYLFRFKTEPVIRVVSHA